MKRRNGRGAKGGRKVDACGTDRRKQHRWECPKGLNKPEKIRGRWSWVEPSVWTERMLTALEVGVKGGKWFSLIDKVCSERSLRSAFAKVKRNRGGAGVDRVTIGMFEADLDSNVHRLAESLNDGTYRPQAIRRVWIPKPGRREKRPLGIPTVPANYVFFQH